MKHTIVRRSLTLTAALLFSISTPVLAQKPDILERMGIQTGYTVDREIMVPMRDGVRLSTAVLRPEKVAERMPVVLIRTPYLKDEELLGLKDIVSFLLQHGYILVVQSERGTGWSEGQYQILAGARNDGYDTLSWIVAQPWSNGKVGTVGCSSSGDNQILLSALNHPAHKAMITMGSGSAIGTLPGLASQGLFYRGGCRKWDRGRGGMRCSAAMSGRRCRRGYRTTSESGSRISIPFFRFRASLRASPWAADGG